MAPRSIAIFATVIACSGCATELAGPTQSRVWSTANSNDGYAACPRDTTVTGGGFEMKQTDVAAGHVPLVIASRPENNGWRVMCVDPTWQPTTACRSWAVCASVLAR